MDLNDPIGIRAMSEEEKREALSGVASGKVQSVGIDGKLQWLDASKLTIQPASDLTITLPSAVGGGGHFAINNGMIVNPHIEKVCPPTFEQAREVYRETYQASEMGLGLHANISMLAQDAGASNREANYWTKQFLENWLSLDYSQFAWWADFEYSPAVRMVSRIELRGKCGEMFGERIESMGAAELFRLIGALGEMIASTLGEYSFDWGNIEGIVGEILLEIPDGMDWHEEVLDLCWSQACKSRIDRIDRGRSVTIGGVIDAID